jgi:hypothetical protein
MKQTVTEVLDEAICALMALDLDRLESLEQRMDAIAADRGSRRGEDTRVILEKKQLLTMILENCRSNLNALNRLRGRNTRGPWAH